MKTSHAAAPIVLACISTCAGEPVLRVETGAARAEITVLSWDTEGTGRESANLLRAQTAATLRIRRAGQWRNGTDLPTRVQMNARGDTSYWITVAPDTEIK